MPGAAGPTGRAPRAHRLDAKWHPESVSIATRRGTRVRVQRRDRLTAAPGNGAVTAIAEGEPLSRVPPARSSVIAARGINAAWPRRTAAPVHESPLRRSRDAHHSKVHADGSTVSSRASVFGIKDS